MNYDELCRLFKSARERLGLTQVDVADKLCISVKAYSKIETGVNALRFEYVRPLCELLDIPYIRALGVLGPLVSDIDTEFDRYNRNSQDRSLIRVDVSSAANESVVMTQEEYAMFIFLADYFGYDTSDSDFILLFSDLLQHRMLKYIRGLR